MLSKIWKRVGQIIGKCIIIGSALFVFPIAILGYIWGITVVSFRLGQTLANAVASQTITQTIKKRS